MHPKTNLADKKLKMEIGECNHRESPQSFLLWRLPSLWYALRPFQTRQFLTIVWAVRMTSSQSRAGEVTATLQTAKNSAAFCTTFNTKHTNVLHCDREVRSFVALASGWPPGKTGCWTRPMFLSPNSQHRFLSNVIQWQEICGQSPKTFYHFWFTSA